MVVPILADICCHNSVLFAFCALNVHNPGQRNSFCGVSTCFDVCFAYFVRLLFFSYLFGFDQFKFAGFDVFLRCSIYFAFCFVDIGAQH